MLSDTSQKFIKLCSTITIIGGFILIISADAHARATATNQLPTPLLVEETIAQLEQLGCAVITEENGEIDTPDEATYHIQAQDAQPNQHGFCTQAQLLQLTQKDGQIAGITSQAQAQGGFVGGILGASLAGANTPGSLLPGAVGVIAPGAGAAGAAIGGIAEIGGKWGASKVIGLLHWMVLAIAYIGVWVLWGGTALVNYALSPTQFATHDLVKFGWPIMQGIANLGFILALLAIAFGTTLQLQDFTARRMLPRLLFAALLINFSLLLGTIIVDGSRLLMAIEIRVLGAGGQAQEGVTDISAVGNAILGNSGLDQALTHALHRLPGFLSPIEFGLTQPLSDGWTGLMMALFAAILVWGTALGFIIIGVMLIVRHIAILLLLIASPFAFLAIAIPRADGIARQWWGQFLKYVLYGPAVLFLLILLMRAQGIANFFGRAAQGHGAFWFDTLVSLTITIMLMYFAAIAGRYMGLVGSAATVSFVSGKAKQIGRVGGLGGAGLAIGVGGRLAEQGIRAAAKSSGLSETGFGRAVGAVYKGTKKAAVATTKATLGKGGETLVAGAGLGSQAVKGGTDLLERQQKSRDASTIDSSTLGGKGAVKSDSRLSADKLSSIDYLTGLQQATLGRVIADGSQVQHIGIASGITAMKEAPSNAKDFFNTVINKSVEVSETADTTIKASDKILADPTKSDGEKKAATELKNNAVRSKEGVQQILRSLANNPNLVTKMKDEHKGKLLESADKETVKNLLKSQAKIRDKKEDSSK